MNERTLRIKKITLIALFSAMLTGGKLALSFIPNVEVVTLLILLFSYAFGFRIAVPAVLIFCTAEWIFFGFGYWVPVYYIYWTSLTFASCLLRKISEPLIRYAAYTALACAFSAMFGVLSSAVDAAIISNLSASFPRLFVVIYARGISFYVTHIVSNGIITALLFPPLSAALKYMDLKYFGAV